MPRPFYPRKRPRHPLNWGLGGGDPISDLNILESRKLSYPVGILTPDSLAGRLIAVLTELLMAVCVLDTNAVIMLAAS